MTKNKGVRRFWLVTLAAVVVAAGTCALGFWQLGRAAQKQALQAAIQSQTSQGVLDNAALLALSDSPLAVHRQAVLRGVWRADKTVFLDNRPMRDKTGFFVVTPLVLEGSGRAVLVQRGWVQRNFTDRTQLPSIVTPTGPVSVSGRMAPAPSRLYVLGSGESGVIRQNIDVGAFAIETGLPLMALSLLQTGTASEGLQRDWALPNTGVEKHYGYAFQWFAMCALVIGLYVWFQVLAPRRRRSKSQAPGADTAEPPSPGLNP